MRPRRRTRRRRLAASRKWDILAAFLGTGFFRKCLFSEVTMGQLVT